MAWKMIDTSKYGVVDIVSTNGNLSELPINGVSIGSGATYTDPTTGELHIYKLTSADGTIDNLVWKEI